jgi:hypothetical protein
MTATVEVIKDPFLSVDGTDISDQVSEIQLNFALDEIESTASGDSCHVFVPGLEKPTASAKMFKNYGAGSVDELLWNTRGQLVPFVMRRKRAAKGVSNPEFAFEGFMGQIPLISGAVGTAEELTINIGINTPIQRSTS